MKVGNPARPGRARAGSRAGGRAASNGACSLGAACVHYTLLAYCLDKLAPREHTASGRAAEGEWNGMTDHLLERHPSFAVRHQARADMDRGGGPTEIRNDPAVIASYLGGDPTAIDRSGTTTEGRSRRGVNRTRQL